MGVPGAHHHRELLPVWLAGVEDVKQLVLVVRLVQQVLVLEQA